MILVLVELKLLYPYHNSVLSVFDLSSPWGLRVIKTSTRSEVAYIAFPWQKFKLMFGKNPQLGELELPSPLNTFIAAAWVRDIAVQEDD